MVSKHRVLFVLKCSSRKKIHWVLGVRTGPRGNRVWGKYYVSFLFFDPLPSVMLPQSYFGWF